MSYVMRWSVPAFGALAGYAALGSSEASAAACVLDSVANYVAAGATPCTTGDLSLSSFSFTPSADSCGSEVSTFGNSVTAFVCVSAGSGDGYTFGFSVAAAAGKLITGLSLSGDFRAFIAQSQLTGDGTLSGGGTASVLLVPPPLNGTFTDSDSVTFPGIASGQFTLTVDLTRGVTSFFDIGFTVADAPPATVPEPASLALLGIGLTTLAGLRARRRARRATALAA